MKYLNLKALIETKMENQNKMIGGGNLETIYSENNSDDLPNMLTETPISEQFGGKKVSKKQSKKKNNKDEEFESPESELSDSSISSFSSIESSSEEY